MTNIGCGTPDLAVSMVVIALQRMTLSLLALWDRTILGKLINEIFEPVEQVSHVQAQLLESAFEMLSGGPAQIHVGTGGGGSSSDMPWGEKNDGNMTTSIRKRWHLVANQ